MNIKLVKIITLITVIIALAGCGYQFKSNLPEHLKTVYVPVFPNDTIQFGLGSQLTNDLINELNLDGTLKKSTRAQADSEFNGKVVAFSQTPVSFYEDKSVKEYRVYVKIFVEFKDLKRNKVIWKGHLSRQENYIVKQVSGEDPTNRSGVFFSKEEALNEIVKGLARDIVSRTMEGW